MLRYVKDLQSAWGQLSATSRSDDSSSSNSEFEIDLRVFNDSPAQVERDEDDDEAASQQRSIKQNVHTLLAGAVIRSEGSVVRKNSVWRAADGENS